VSEPSGPPADIVVLDAGERVVEGDRVPSSESLLGRAEGQVVDVIQDGRGREDPRDGR
jgi:hypothetical protein